LTCVYFDYISEPITTILGFMFISANTFINTSAGINTTFILGGFINTGAGINTHILKILLESGGIILIAWLPFIK